MPKEPPKFNFSLEKYNKLKLSSDMAAEAFLLASGWTASGEGGDAWEINFDGYLQSWITGRTEPLFINSIDDPKLCEPYADLGITKIGILLDSVPRGNADFIHLLLGYEENDEYFFSVTPLLLDQQAGTVEIADMLPYMILNLILNKTAKRPHTYQGAWAFVDEDWKDAEQIIKKFKHAQEGVGEIHYTGDSVIVCGDVMVVKNAKPRGPDMSAQDAFEQLLVTCKMNALISLQQSRSRKKAEAELRKTRVEMEGIYMNCVAKLQTMMLRRPHEFEGMALPLEDMYGMGMGYFGLLYSTHFTIVIQICKFLEVALGIIRDLFNENADQIECDGYKVLPWNSKSQSSIFTKITDYAEVPTEPSILTSCGLLGIKDYLRTRLIVPPEGNAKESTEHYLSQYKDADIGIQDVVYKDKSFRFKPDGQAIYVTGFFMIPVGFAHFKILEEIEKIGLTWTCLTCKSSDEGPDETHGMWSIPFEIQAVNQAALDFINGAHHTYEIQRVAFRISSVCECSKSVDKKGKPLPQTQCANCQYRLSIGKSYCPFCHICFNSVTQKRFCTKACCEGETAENDIDEAIRDMEHDALKERVKSMDAELKMWRSNFGDAVGSGGNAAKMFGK